MQTKRSTGRDQHRGAGRRFFPRPLALALLLAGLQGPAGALDYVWLGGNGDWNNAANWSLLGTPGSGDRATVNSGTASLAGNAGLSHLVYGNAVLTGAGTLTVSGSHSLAGAGLYGAGVLNLLGNGSIANLALDDARVVNLGGHTVWNGGSIYFNRLDGGGGGGTINNLAGALFDLQGNNTMEAWSGNAGVLNNAGTLHKTAGGSTSTINTLLHNSGVVQSSNSLLLLNGGGTHSGSFAGVAGGVVGFGRGAHALLAGSQLSGAITFDGFNWNQDVTTIDGTLATAELTLRSDADVVLQSQATTTALNLLSNARLRGVGNLTVSGAHNLDGGYLTGSGVLNLQGNGSIGNLLLDDARIVNNHATTVWSGGSIYFNRLDSGGGGGTINNLAGAVWDIQSNHTMEAWSGSAGVFNNVGTFHKTAGGGTSTINSPLHNSGVVRASNGVLLLNGGGTHSGSFAGTDGGVVMFGRGAHELQAASQLSGAITFDGFNWNQDVTTIHGTLAPSQLTLQSDADVVLQSHATAGTLNLLSSARLRGAGNLTVSGAHNLNGGYLTGSGTLNLQSNGSIASLALDDARVINNHATTVWSGGSIYFNRLDGGGGGGTINNLVGAVWDIQSNHTMEAWNSGAGVFNNAGTFHKTAGGGTSTINALLHNSGTLQSSNGVLLLNGGGTHSGSFAGTDGGVVMFGRGAHALQAGSQLSGAIAFDGFNWNQDVTTIHGTLAPSQLTLQSDADVVLQSHATAGTLNLLSSARLRGAGNLTVSGAHNLNGGYLTGSGTLNLQSNGSIASLALDDARVINNHATTVWSGGNVYFNRLDSGGGGGTINNLVGAVWDIQSNHTMEPWNGSAGVFNNAGTLVKSAGGGTSRIDTALNNSGVVVVEQGRLRLGALSNTGVLRVAEGAILELALATQPNQGQLRGNGEVIVGGGNGSLDNQGLIAPGLSIGALSINGGLALGAASIFEVELSSLASFDQLLLTDGARLGGALKVVSLGYAPVVGDSFDVMTYSQWLGGNFASVSYSGFDVAVDFDVIYGADKLTLTVASVTAVPEPSTWLMTLAGILAVGAVARRRRSV